MKKLLAFISAFGLLFLAFSCGEELVIINQEPDETPSDSVPDDSTVTDTIQPVDTVLPEPPQPQAPVLTRAQKGFRDFGMNYFKAVVASEPAGKNIVVSPFSAATLLSMTANALEGKALDEVLNLFGCDSLAALNELSKTMISTLPTIDRTVKFSQANSLWYTQGWQLNPGFSKSLSDVYSAEMFAAEMQSSATMDAINRWVADKTNNLIQTILDEPLGDLTVAFIANALYFKGPFTHPFYADLTKDAVFHGTSGNRTVPTMHGKDSELVYIGEDFSAVRLAFGGGSFEIVCVLPPAGQSIDSFIASGVVNDISTRTFTTKSLDLYLPKFKLASEKPIVLDKPLAILGLNNFFKQESSNMFTHLQPLDFKISQKATITVDEIGAEGSALTWGDIAGDSGVKRTLMNFDRPFVFFINEASTGICLFAGRVNDID